MPKLQDFGDWPDWRTQQPRFFDLYADDQAVRLGCRKTVPIAMYVHDLLTNLTGKTHLPTCVECNAPIGGRRHTLRSDNARDLELKALA